MKKRKLMIVVEETGTDNGRGFNVYLSGDTERLKTLKNEEDMSPAEFCGSKIFIICADAIKKSGVVQREV